MTTTAALPLDWNAWCREWNQWRAQHREALEPTRARFPGKNFLADEILGTWSVNGRIVELSEVTFPNLEERDDEGRLIEKTIRGIGITTADPDTLEDRSGTIVHTFEELERELSLE